MACSMMHHRLDHGSRACHGMCHGSHYGLMDCTRGSTPGSTPWGTFSMVFTMVNHVWVHGVPHGMSNKCTSPDSVWFLFFVLGSPDANVATCCLLSHILIPFLYFSFFPAICFFLLIVCWPLYVVPFVSSTLALRCLVFLYTSTTFCDIYVS